MGSHVAEDGPDGQDFKIGLTMQPVPRPVEMTGMLPVMACPTRRFERWVREVGRLTRGQQTRLTGKARTDHLGFIWG